MTPGAAVSAYGEVGFLTEYVNHVGNILEEFSRPGRLKSDDERLVQPLHHLLEQSIRIGVIPFDT